jgi:hypothetical protein
LLGIFPDKSFRGFASKNWAGNIAIFLRAKTDQVTFWYFCFFYLQNSNLKFDIGSGVEKNSHRKKKRMKNIKLKFLNFCQFQSLWGSRQFFGSFNHHGAKAIFCQLQSPWRTEVNCNNFLLEIVILQIKYTKILWCYPGSFRTPTSRKLFANPKTQQKQELTSVDGAHASAEFNRILQFQSVAAFTELKKGFGLEKIKDEF